MRKPRIPHFQVAKMILRYLKGTLDFGIFYSILIVRRMQKEKSMAIATQIGVEIKEIGKLLLVMSSNLSQQQFLGVQGSKE